MQAAPAYRRDIDGLRALAVLAVIAYHAFPRAVRGGFAGVDVFFVISGFLISGIVVHELERRRFRFRAFYGRRLRRLAPALLLVMASCLSYGSIVLLPVEMAALGQQVAAAAVFVPNVVFWLQAGYFDQAAAGKPLLHLWSLGVEEQFYLLWPAALYCLSRAEWPLKPAIVAVTSTSFIVNMVLSRINLDADFYSPLSRFWELGLGALVAVRSASPREATTRTNGAMAALGLCLMLAAFSLLSAAHPFPGWQAMLPVAGTALLIAAGSATWISRVILSSRPAVAIGLISYPLYLWHWPLLSFATIIRQGRPPTPLMAAGLLAAAFALAALTTRFIEAPLRHGARRRTITAGLIAGMALLAACGAASWRTRGFSARFSPLPALDIAKINAAIGDGIFQPTASMAVTRIGLITVARIEPRSPIPGAVLLAGDSLVFQYGPRFQRLLQEGRLRRTVIFVTGPSCPPVSGIVRPGRFAACAALPGIMTDLLARQTIQTIILGALWPGLSAPGVIVTRIGTSRATTAPDAMDALYANLRDDVARLSAPGRAVYLLLCPPFSKSFDPRNMIARSPIGVRIDPAMLTPLPVAGLRGATASADSRLRATGRVLDPWPDICGAGPGCPALDASGAPKFADEMHLRPGFVAANMRFLDDMVTK